MVATKGILFCRKKKLIHSIPAHLSWEEAVMIEPFTIAEQVCARAEITQDDVVFIMGRGL
ncbi:MAG: hypothetical protein R2822_10215 [Spirosomataceae bacterium]